MSIIGLPGAAGALRNLVSRPVTRRYPAAPRVIVTGARGSAEFNMVDCVLCGLCARRCPTAAIAMSREEGWFAIDRLACIACGACADACNKGSISMSGQTWHVYAAPGPGARPGRQKWCRTPWTGQESPDPH